MIKCRSWKNTIN